MEPYGKVLLPRSVRLDGVRVTANGSEYSVNKPIRLPAGTWTVRLEAPGTHPIEEVVDLQAGQEFRWTQGFEKVDPAMVKLRIKGPVIVEVLVDGQEKEIDELPVRLRK